MGKTNQNPWQEHLEKLDEHYAPDNFFAEQNNKPSSLEKITEDYFANTLPESLEMPEQGQLNIDIFEDEQNLYVIAPMAGVNPEEINLTVEKDVLTIKGGRRDNYTENIGECVYRECYWGSFSRSIILPCTVKENEVKAEFEKHILKITLPKETEKQAVEIKIA